jgi:glycosyltransferase involved in cell wall biosynthesis
VELAAAGVRVQGLHVSRRRTLACARRLRDALPDERPLIVHAHLFHANLAARLAYGLTPAPARTGLHVLGTVHVAEHRFRPWQFALDRISARYAKAEVCVSRAVAKFQQERTGLPAAFFRVIENGIDLSRFAVPLLVCPSVPQGADRRQPRSVAPPDESAPLVVSVGRLDPQKDFATLLRAWKALHANVPMASLVIAGTGPEEAALKELCASLRLENVSFPGFVQDVPALLRRATLYVQPSAWEGFGLAAAEAMAMGLPVVVSDADSLPEIVTNGRTGLVVPKGMPEALAEEMLRLLRDPDHAAELGAAARAEAQRRFSVERMVADYARLYQEILCGS